MKAFDVSLIIVIKKVNQIKSVWLLFHDFRLAEEDELGFEENDIITNVQKVFRIFSFLFLSSWTKFSLLIFRCMMNGGLEESVKDPAYFLPITLKKSSDTKKTNKTLFLFCLNLKKKCVHLYIFLSY